MRSVTATIAAIIGVLSILVLVLAPVAAQLGVLSPLAAFATFGLGLIAGMVLSLVFGAIGLVRTRARTGLSGRERAWLGTLVGLGLLALMAGFRMALPDSPIHDVTTNIEDPPAFSDAVRNREDRLNGVDYPDGGEEVPAVQREKFPDLATITVGAPPAEVVQRARQAAETLGWTVTSVDAEAGIVEAYDVTLVFRFVDDVVIRVRPAETGSSAVDVRSNSRVGGGDIAANAKRIRAFRDELSAAP
jgi:uncharacterized protein (DUF1499 family)